MTDVVTDSLIATMQERINGGANQAALDIWQEAGAPESRELLLLVGVAQQQLGLHADAHASLLRSLECDPQYPLALRQLAYLSFHTSDYSAAVEWAGHYQKYRPYSVDAFNWKVFALKESGRLKEAEEELAAYAKVFPYTQTTIQSEIALGEVKHRAVHTLLMAGRLPFSTWHGSFFGQSVFGSWYHLGNKALCKKTLDIVYAGIDPKDEVDYMLALGDLAQLHHRQEEALEWYELAVKANSGPPINGINEALASWAIGNFARGAEAYRRRDKTLQTLRIPDIPEWNGENPAGKTILVHSEQGAGDVIQFIRYMPYLREQAGAVLFNTYPDIVSLLRADTSNEKVSLDESVLENIDYQTWMMEVPSFLRPNGIADFPVETPYLFPNQDKITIWREKLAPYTGLKIGLVWAGNPIHVNDANRSASLEEWKLLAELEGINWFSLQKGVGTPEAAYPPPGFAVTDLSEQIGDFSDTAAILANLDLLISVDTSVAHLAGACDFPCWVLLPHKGKDWRWCNQGETPSWYPSIRAFTLGENENWTDLLTRLVLPRLIEMGARKREMPVTPLSAALDQANRSLASQSPDQTVALAEQLLQDFPGEPRLFLISGQALTRLGDTQGARTRFEQVLKIQPRNVHANRMLAGLIGHNDLRLSSAHLQTALRLATHDKGLWREAAGFFLAQHAPMIAYQIMEDLYAADPDQRNATLLAETLMRLGNIEVAAQLVENIDPESVVDHDQLRWLTYIYAWQDWREKARLTMDRLSALFPDNKDDALLSGTTLIRWGEFSSGWAFYNKACWPEPAEIPLSIPLWQGESLEHKHLLIYQDQGYGDLLQFFVLLEMDAPSHGKVTLSVFGEALALLRAQALPPNVRIIGHDTLKEEPPGTYDYRIGLMHWVAGIAPDLNNPPRQGPYLSAPTGLLPHWVETVGNDPGFKVGMVWAGNPRHFNDVNRSTQLGDWLPLAQTPGISWYNLQRDSASNQLLEYPQFRPYNIVADCGRLDDTASAIMMLDLVISIDSGLAHLAAALGKEVWVVLPPRGDFRWQLEGDDCPWYSTMRLFRQKINEPWREVFERVAQALSKRIEACDIR